MYLKEINQIPDRNERYSKQGNQNLKGLVLDFYNSSMEYCEIIFNHGEYSSSQNLYSGVRQAIKALKDIPVMAEYIQGSVYLRRAE